MLEVSPRHPTPLTRSKRMTAPAPGTLNNPTLRSILAENRVHLKDAPRHSLSVSIGKSSVTESVT